MQWKDVTSFSKGDSECIPRTFMATAAGLRITVTRHIDYAPTEWVLTCPPLFSQVIVNDGTADDAKAAAITAVRDKLTQALEELVPNAELTGGFSAKGKQDGK